MVERSFSPLNFFSFSLFSIFVRFCINLGYYDNFAIDYTRSGAGIDRISARVEQRTSDVGIGTARYRPLGCR